MLARVRFLGEEPWHQGTTAQPIVVGAMKAGTSSLHHILSQHKGVFFAEREIYFFDMDDVEQHPDFLALSHICVPKLFGYDPPLELRGLERGR
jgi:hypothetical protein